MNLISILLFATAALTLLVGILVFLGSSKADRVRSAWLGVSYLGGAFWVAACAVFLQLPETAVTFAPYVVVAIYVGALVLLPCIMNYACWYSKLGRTLSLTAVAVALILSALIIFKPDLLYTSIDLSARGNSVALVNGWLYWCFAGVIASTGIGVVVGVVYQGMHSKVKRVRIGNFVLASGMTITALLAAIFNTILPLFVRYDLIWIGPLAMVVTMLTHFYVILKYRIISISGTWLRALSYVVLLATGTLLYMVIFYLIFTALFKIPNPSASILVLNFIMIVIVLLLIPVINEARALINSLISVGQVDIAYVIKKLNKLAVRHVDLRELAGFLADHLHFTYVGFILNGKLYGSKSLAVSADELKQIAHMKTASAGEVWQQPNKSVEKTLDELGLKAVAELRNAKGKPFGQIVVGKPTGKTGFERRDLIQLEMIINLVATVIDSEKHIRA